MTDAADSPAAPPSVEHARLAESPGVSGPWRQWGPYLAGRQWGTVREDYSADGDAWQSFPFDQSHLRAYRWGEDGLGGISDRFGFLNFAFALWNRKDPILKERLFGLTNGEGNHGEDAKEYWWVVDGTPTHSWMQWLYRYPQAEYPYQQLREENASRGRDDREYELSDTGILDENRFFDVQVTYAKASPDDICIVISVTNHGPDAASVDLLPHLWFRNTWAWGRDERRGTLDEVDPSHLQSGAVRAVEAQHGFLGRYYLAAEGRPRVLFCDNDTNAAALWGQENRSAYSKDGIGRRVVDGDEGAVDPEQTGTKSAFWYSLDDVAPGETREVKLRLSTAAPDEQTFGRGFDAVVADRRAEADEFYRAVIGPDLSDDDRHVARRAYAGLLWTKQLYRYDVEQWIEGDKVGEPSPEARRGTGARNSRWQHLALADVISMPDEWEYPWFAAWDLAFHTIPLAHVDPDFAKEQLVLMCREWSMHPNGQLPAYEWEFGDVNPPVHAWAAWHVYRIDGYRDREFLVRVFTKLLLNFAWWVNRKDSEGSNIFEGGFLGMDNIGLFNRSAPLPPGFRLEQSDATSWMAFYCQQMFKIALELARHDRAWDDAATKFFAHFLSIARAVKSFGSQHISLWHDEDGFFYDVLVPPEGDATPMRVRSMVGLLPILGATEIPSWVEKECPDLTARLRWVQQRRPEMVSPLLARKDGDEVRVLLSLVEPERLKRVLSRMFDSEEFLSQYGIRSLSASYRDAVTYEIDGRHVSIEYEPGESRTGMFGGNSNWRGPIWFPVNVLLADKLRAYGRHYGDSFTIEIPTGSGNHRTLTEAADLIDDGLASLFRPVDGKRPADGDRIESTDDPLWSVHPTFNEYFDGDTGEGLGASHQTGWTGLVAHLLRPRLPL
ncbi:glucosidase [Rhodococcus sp. BP-252]|uniref:MGH1-like glycoside hydrolase domain-containing protein n=1 Tax=unclassified Rhodococcus (in: high G+C Gram-positive bacteria) TaxID=192944 RepID=UPI001C9A95B2|nr:MULTISPECIES: glucosidase [unclassified Rhodococcus (in: high G+C Gram-positive bacteria)]MBY6411032.1 glucosidase [Rhodococcus sp. BP-320]MBY6415691.1 glucosidase [Rhodococcus sp. BP-321]MBY6420927.1 glucosidase [Rhodococcus sp. BP-324]MBY6425982.1 glucosidase [Rhodococcus sp. BP-323]MBY6430897.1 glucosidase [Rhodococcus sp. BP-322]